jgi:hypothetical protein
VKAVGDYVAAKKKKVQLVVENNWVGFGW